MGQSNYIAAAIALAFIVYITVKGNLPKYLGILTGSGGYAQDTASAGNAPQQTASADGNSGKTGQTASTGSSSGQSNSSGSSASNTAGAVAGTTKSILQQVGGDPSTLLDGVHMFDLAGMIGG